MKAVLCCMKWVPGLQRGSRDRKAGLCQANKRIQWPTRQAGGPLTPTRNPEPFRGFSESPALESPASVASAQSPNLAPDAFLPWRLPASRPYR